MKKIILSSVFGLLVSCGAMAQNSLILNKGQKFSVENKVNAVSTQEMMGQSMQSKADINSYNTIEVKDIQDNNINLTNNIIRMTGAFTIMGQDMNFDSDKKEDLESTSNGMGLKDIINHPRDVSIDKTGKVIPAKKDDVKAADAEMSGMMSKLLGASPNDASFGVGFLFITLPKNVAVGYTWKDSINHDGIKNYTTYIVNEIKGTDAIISFIGTLDTDTHSEVQGVDVSTKTSGKLKGEEIVDTNSGVLKNRNTTLETSGTLSAQGMDIPTSSKITNTISVKGS